MAREKSIRSSKAQGLENSPHQAICLAFSLSAREGSVLACLFEHGRQAASSVARICEAPRNTVRGTLDGLVRKGLVTCTRKGNTQFYELERGESLLQLLEHRRESQRLELESQLSAVKSNLSFFDRKADSATRPRITFYDGYDGLKKVYEDTLTSKSEIRSWASFDSNREILPRYFETYYSRRAKKGIPISGIMPETPLSRAHSKLNRKFLRKTVLIPEDEFRIGPEIQVYDNKVNIVSWNEKLGLIIESPEIARAVKAIFDLNYSALLKTFPEWK